MPFRSGLPPDDSGGDYRGPYGIGRPAHGSDPTASYQFGAPSYRSNIRPKITVHDLQYELQADGEERACLTVCVTATDQALKFDLTFPLERQAGHVEVTLVEAQSRLLDFLDAVLQELRTNPIARE